MFCCTRNVLRLRKNNHESDVGKKKTKNSRNILDVSGRLSFSPCSLQITSGPTSAKKFEPMARTKTSYECIFLHISEILCVILHVRYVYDVMMSRTTYVKDLFKLHDYISYFRAYPVSSFILLRCLQCKSKFYRESDSDVM